MFVVRSTLLNARVSIAFFPLEILMCKTGRTITTEDDKINALTETPSDYYLPRFLLNHLKVELLISIKLLKMSCTIFRF